MEYFFEKKVCIVGSGFCGYTAYKKLFSKDVDLLIIEGGDIRTPISVDEQPFYKVASNSHVASINVNNKISKIKNFNVASFGGRKYTVGGSSQCWGGMIKPIEETTYLNKYASNKQKWGDFDLLKYNEESLKILNSPILNFDTDLIAESLNLELPELPKGFYYSAYSWANPTVRLKDFWSKRATQSPKEITNKKNLLFNYKLVDASIKDNKIEYLVFTSKKDRLIVKADIFIIGLGGIENARFAQKLNKKDKFSNEVKYSLGGFQAPPHIYDIAGFDSGKKKIPNILKDKIPYYSKGKLVGEVKFTIVAWDGIGTPKVAFEIYSVPKTWTGFIKSKIRDIRYFDFYLNMRCSQTPNPKSSLTFNDKKANLNWRVLNSDFKIYSEYLKKLVSFLRYKSMVNNFTLMQESNNGFAFPETANGGPHHMSTVPYLETGSIIDKNFKHKIFNNIYIVGSSGFSISGFENPTVGAISSALAAVEDIKNKL